MAETRAVPPEFHTVTPYLIMKNAVEALEFYKRAFGAIEKYKLLFPDGRLAHAQIALGDSQIMFCEECQEYGGKSPQTLGGSPVTLYVYVEDVDAFFERALAAGATELHPVRDQFYGDRSGQLMDPFGHVWSIASPKENVSPEEIQKRMEALCVSQK